MQTRQVKTHNPTSTTKEAESTKKAASSPVALTRLPAWTNAWANHLPANLQAKLTVNQPSDIYEQEADRVAEQVMRMPNPSVQRKCACGGTPGPTGECEECAKKRMALQRKSSQSASDSTAPPIVNSVLSSSGTPMDASTRSFMEPRFGQDFSGVRIHTDQQATESAQAVNALAYTVGSDVVFGAGQYMPETSRGQKLLAHELTHVVQQGAELTIRRFVGKEHRDIGDLASGNKKTDINIGTAAHPEFLTFGEVVAMAGDYFESIEQMENLADPTKYSDGREQLQWARWKDIDEERPQNEPSVAESVKKKVMDRYYNLAGKNISHFSAGGTAKQTYEGYHRQALNKAFDSGFRGNAPSIWEQALTIEAFGNHFLTDMFAAGHVRTERQDIKGWYEKNYPDAIKLFVSYMAEQMHIIASERHVNFALHKIDIHTPWKDYRIPSQTEIEQQIHALAGNTLQAFGLGDLVSLAIHNIENMGLDVVSLVNEKGIAPKGSFHFRAVGDENLHLSPVTKNMAVAAVRSSLEDLQTMQQAGAAAATGRQLKGQGVGKSASEKALARLADPPFMFKSEHFIPYEDQTKNRTEQNLPIGDLPIESLKGNIARNWQWGHFDQQMRQVFDLVIRDFVAFEIRKKASGQKEKEQRAILAEFAKRLAERGTTAIEDAIHKKAGPY